MGSGIGLSIPSISGCVGAGSRSNVTMRAQGFVLGPFVRRTGAMGTNAEVRCGLLISVSYHIPDHIEGHS